MQICSCNPVIITTNLPLGRRSSQRYCRRKWHDPLDPRWALRPNTCHGHHPGLGTQCSSRFPHPVSLSRLTRGFSTIDPVSRLRPALTNPPRSAYGNLTDGCTSTGTHYNPFGKLHGGPTATERHAGDLGNVQADANGVATIDITDTQVQLSGPYSVVG